MPVRRLQLVCRPSSPPQASRRRDEEDQGGARSEGKRKKGGILAGWCFCWPTVRLSSDLIIICCFLILHLENHFGRDCTVWKFIWNHRVRPQLQLPVEAEARFLSNSFCFGENFCSYWRTFRFRFIIKGYQLSIWACLFLLLLLELHSTHFSTLKHSMSWGPSPWPTSCRSKYLVIFWSTESFLWHESTLTLFFQSHSSQIDMWSLIKDDLLSYLLNDNVNPKIQTAFIVQQKGYQPPTKQTWLF